MSIAALSIRQPWAWAICAGHKDVENRSWNTSHRGWFAVHAGGRTPTAVDIAWIRDMIGIVVPADLARGALIGVARLVDVVENSDSPWAQPDQLHWLVTDGRLWSDPIPCRGRLGFFRPLELGE